MHTAKDQKGPRLGPHPEPTYIHTQFSLTLIQYCKFLQNVTTICPVNNNSPGGFLTRRASFENRRAGFENRRAGFGTRRAALQKTKIWDGGRYLVCKEKGKQKLLPSTTRFTRLFRFFGQVARGFKYRCKNRKNNGQRRGRTVR